MKKLIYIQFIVSIILCSCGDGSTGAEKSNDELREELSLVALEGTWTGCQIDGANSFRTTLVANGVTATTTIEFFQAVTNCTTTPAFTSVKIGTYKIASEGAQVTGPNGAVTAFNLDVTTTAFLMTPNSAFITTSWNIGSVCGKNDWVAGATSSALGLVNCDPILGTDHPDEVSGGVITNLIAGPSNNQIVLNIEVSSAGSVQSRPVDLDGSNVGNVVLDRL